MRVLIVEDEVRLAATLQDLLEMNGYTADVSHDGESGLDNALTDIYDVVLLDVMLPKLNGFEVLRRLAALRQSCDFLLSLMSQYTPYRRDEQCPELNRRISTYEYRRVYECALQLGFDGFMQERSSAREEYTPAFDLSGV